MTECLVNHDMEEEIILEAIRQNSVLEAALKEAAWTFAQIVQIHSSDHGDAAERCMELGKIGFDAAKAAIAAATGTAKTA